MSYTTPRDWTAGEKVTAAMMNTHVRDNISALYSDLGGKLQVAIQSATVTKNATTTPGDLTDLNFSIGASETWYFWAQLHGYSEATPDFRFAATVPSGATGLLAVNPSGGTSAGSASIGTDLFAPSAGAVDQGLQLFGHVVNSTTAGTVQLQFAQWTSNGTDSKIYQYSFLWAYRTA